MHPDDNEEAAVEPTLTELAAEWFGMAEAAVLVAARRNELQDQIIAVMSETGTDVLIVGDMVFTVQSTSAGPYLAKRKAVS
jgi:hypothetical protein